MIALITGASGGLGSFLSCLLWDRGYSLILISRSLNNLEATRALLSKKRSQSCDLFACDMSRLDELNSVLESIERRFPEISLIVNNAGAHGPIGDFSKVNFQEWVDLFNVNLFGHAAIIRKFIPQLTRSNNGSIINIAGGGATSPRENFSAYATSKTAIVRLGEILAIELAQFNISVNSISPGAMPTKLLREVAESPEEAAGANELDLAKKVFLSTDAEKNQIFKRVGELVLFLASPRGRKITGKLISAQWDNWHEWQLHLDDLLQSDVYTIRRIIGKDRGMNWGDL
jgi:NAD(P)-dependent dehydrogenase (short-subunit alcohol dehydrogenase family)